MTIEHEYAWVVEKQPAKAFLVRYFHDPTPAESLVLVSPWIGTLEKVGITLEGLCRRASKDGTRVYVITNEPKEEPQQKAIDILAKFPLVEIRYNDALHAKVYVCVRHESYESFGLLGSANLTQTSIRQKLEIGIMVLSRGKGRDILRQLEKWGLAKLRTFSTTRVFKHFNS